MDTEKIFKLLWLWIKKNFSVFHVTRKAHYMYCWHGEERIFKFRIKDDKLEIWNNSLYEIIVMENALCHYVLVDKKFDYYTFGVKEHFTISWTIKKEQG